MSMILLLLTLTAADPVPDLLPTEPFEAPKYGLATRIPKVWAVAVHEEEDRIFVAIIPQKDFDRPGVAACELALACPRPSMIIAPGSTRPPRGTAAPTENLRPIESSRTPAASGSSRSGSFTPATGAFGRESEQYARSPPTASSTLSFSVSKDSDLRQGASVVRCSGRRDAIYGPQYRRRLLLARASNRWIRARVQVCGSTYLKAGPRSSRPARSLSSSLMGRPTAFGPTTFLCWLIPIATPT